MNRFAAIAIVTTGLLAGGNAFAADDPELNKGWDTDYGMIFSFNNILQNNNFLGDYQGMIGGQYNLGPTKALRLGVSLSRTSNPAYETEQTTIAGGTTTTVKSLEIPAGPTSTFGVGLGADYIMAFGTKEMAPYIGGGIGIGWGSSSRAYTDDLNTPNVVEDVDDSATSIGIAARGLAGVSWRIHKSVAVFAEYALELGIMDYTSADTSTKVTAGGATTEVKTSGSQTRFLNMSTGLAQGASLGLVAFF